MTIQSDWKCFFITSPFVILALYCYFAAAVKRLHDIGLTGWISLIALIPPFAWVIAIFLAIKKGNEGINKFGPPPSGIGKKPEQKEYAALKPESKPEPAALDAKQHDPACDDDDLYEKIGNEIATNTADVSTWTRAYAMANGDEQKTKVNYIKLRLEKLKKQT